MIPGMITVLILAVSATLCLMYTISFYRSNLFNDKRKNYLILVMGIAATMWNVSLIGYSISTDARFYNDFFYLLILSFDLYMIFFGFFIGRLVELKKKVHYLLGMMGVVLSVGDWVIFGLAPIHEYFQIHGRTAYYTEMSPTIYYHYFYIVFYLIFWITLVVYSFKEKKLKRQYVFVLKIVLINVIMFLAALPDTLFPLFHIPSYPSSGIGVAIAFIGTIYLAKKENTFSISNDRIYDVIYNEAHIAILALDAEGKVDKCNRYSEKLFGMEAGAEYALTDLIACTDEQLARIMEGSKIPEHLRAQKTNISCNIQVAVSRDIYGDCYGVVLMASDAISEEKILEQQLLIEKTEHISEQLVSVLSKTIEAKDQYTKGHSKRVAKYSVMIGERYGYDEQKLKYLKYAALLHDVGKIGIADAIINKPGRLTDEEFEEMKKHPVIGSEILSEISEIPDLGVGARWHHERYGGNGYPDNITGDDISEVARIIAVADSYDAMTSNRSYRACLAQDIVRDEIENGMGKQFDPRFAQIMLQIIDEDTEYKLHQ